LNVKKALALNHSRNLCAQRVVIKVGFPRLL
jgi:hypothetical protein